MQPDSTIHERFAMSGIRDAAQAVMTGSELMELDSLDGNDGILLTCSADVRIKGDMSAGAGVRGSGVLLVEGSVIGSAGRPCKIEMDKGVFVVGNLRQAEVISRSIQIGKWASKSVLTSQRSLEIGGDVVDVRLCSGSKVIDGRELEAVTRRLAVARNEGELLDQQVSHDQRRTEKLFKATRINFDFSIGKIVTRGANRIEVNLEPFYAVVGDKDPKEIDRALLEFFSKAVVGLLTRVNKQYIMEGANNRKIFTAVVRKLHDLTFLTRKCDKQRDKIREAEVQVAELESSIREDPARIAIGGTIIPNLDVEFTVPDYRDGHRDRKASLALREGPDSKQRTVTQTNSEGEDEVRSVSPMEFAGVTIRLEDGSVVWQPELEA
jgi:hypothetical protein